MNNTSAWKASKSTITVPTGPWLLFAMPTIYTMSLFLFYSADGQGLGQLENKIIRTVSGFALSWITAVFKPQTAVKAALPAYIVGVLLLIDVEVVGATINGSTRWLSLGFTRTRPSEITKIGTPMTVVWYFQHYEGRLKWARYIAALVLILAPVALILKQPDLGTAALIMASGTFVIFFVGLPWRAISVAITAPVAALPLLWNYGMHDYQKTRVLTLPNPTKDPLGTGYHIIQSMIVIGPGGVWGKGWLNGMQTHLDYTPESTIGSIFAVLGEELGLIGNILLLLVHLITLARGLWIVARAQSLYSRILAGILTMTFFCYASVDMSMVSGILPVVGIPLSLVSYSGTATLSIMVVLALLMGIANEHKNLRRHNTDSDDLTESRE